MFMHYLLPLSIWKQLDSLFLPSQKLCFQICFQAPSIFSLLPDRERSVTLVLGFFYESEQVCLSHGHDCGKGFVRGLVPGYGIIWPGKLRDSPQRITPLTPVLFIEDDCKDFQEINFRVIPIPDYNAYKNHVWIMLYVIVLVAHFNT